MIDPVSRAVHIPPPRHPVRFQPVMDNLSSPPADIRLQSIDGAVRAHEQAHLAALGPYASGTVEYSYLIGPNGERYAVGGSIGVDLKPVPGDPEATIRKARAIMAAAYAPLSPSGPDRQVAAAAYRLEMEAVRELAREKDRERGISLYA